MTLQLFMQSTLAMAKYYGFDSLAYEDVRGRAEKRGISTLPFMPPEIISATPKLVQRNSKTRATQSIDTSQSINLDPDATKSVEDYRQIIKNSIGYEGLVRYYITTGWKASQVICRHYMLSLDERNQYLDFLKQEFGVASTLASGILSAVSANGALTNAFLIGTTGANNAINDYQNYRLMAIADREAARILVSAAQDQYAKYFLQQVSDRSKKPADGDQQIMPSFYTYAEALNAVNTIEYQCTREGVRNLANRTLNNAPTNITIDAKTGALVFMSSAATAVNQPGSAPQQAAIAAQSAAAAARIAASSAQNAADSAKDAAAGAQNAVAVAKAGVAPINAR